MLLSVIFPVYNAENYLAEALESILAQTFKDFVILAINDGSIDGSLAILKHYRKCDERIIIIDQPNRKLVPTLNSALAMVKTPFVARHDADDYSHPERFERQVRFLKKNPAVGMVGTTFLVSHCGRGEVQWVPTSHEQIRNHMIVGNCFAHGSIMARTDILRSVGGYPDNKHTQHVEDMALWIRLIQTTRVHNLPDILYVYREYPLNVSSRNRSDQEQRAKRLSKEFAEWYFDEIPFAQRKADIPKLMKPDPSDRYVSHRMENLRWVFGRTGQIAGDLGYTKDAKSRLNTFSKTGEG